MIRKDGEVDEGSQVGRKEVEGRRAKNPVQRCRACTELVHIVWKIPYVTHRHALKT